MKLLREVPIDDRPAELAQLAEPAQQLEVVLDGLAEADPGVDPDPLLGDPRGDRDLDPLGEEGLDVVDDVVVARGRPASCAASPCMCMSTTLAPALGAERRRARGRRAAR